MAMPGYDLPPELAAQQKSIDSRRRIAELMMKMGQQPVQSSNPSSPVSWTQGAAQMLNAYLGARGVRQADQGDASLGQQYQKGLAEEVQRIADMRRGVAPTMDAADNVQDPGTPGDAQGAVRAALMSQYGPVREMGKLDFQSDMRSREAREAQAARLHERQLTLEASAQNAALDRTAREAAAQEANDIKLQIAELRADSGGSGGNPYFTPIYTPQGVMSFDNRKGTAGTLTVDGKPIVRSADDPNLQGRLAGAKATGKATAEREFNMAGIGGVIKQAEDLMTGKVKPTGSSVGSLVDTVGGFFGMSPAGAKEAQTLKSVAGALISKMPRMEGPQSDRDTQLYREMAAEVGNDTVPVERRLAALQAVKNLWMKYEKSNPDAFEAGPDDAPLTAEEQAELDRLRAKHGRR